MHLEPFVGGLGPQIRSFSRYPGSGLQPINRSLSGTGVQVLPQVLSECNARPTLSSAQVILLLFVKRRWPVQLENLVLLCHRHHWLVHEGGWQLVRSEDRRILAIRPAHTYQSWTRAPAELATG